MLTGLEVEIKYFSLTNVKLPYMPGYLSQTVDQTGSGNRQGVGQNKTLGAFQATPKEIKPRQRGEAAPACLLLRETDRGGEAALACLPLRETLPEGTS